MLRVFEPFALMLYRRYRKGETVQQLAMRFDIPEDRVVMRLRAAEMYQEREMTQTCGVALQDFIARG